MKRFAPYVVLIALPLILLAPLVFGGRVLYWGVPLMQFYPWQHLAVETWRMGELPLWNPLVGNGAPLAANLQSGVFYPLNFLYFFLPTELALSYTAALHVVLAGLCLFAFLRSLGLGSFAALISGIAFQLSGFLIARLGFVSITVTLPWVAAWLWRAERIAQSGRGRDALWLAIAVGLGLLAGHAQTALYGLILLAGYALYRSLDARRRRSGVLAASGVLLGVGLAAIQLLPAAELARESQRAGGLDYTFAMTHSYWPWRLLTLFAPDLFGNPAYGNFWGYDNYWENAAYIGVLPLALAALAVVEWGRRRRRMKVEWRMENEELRSANAENTPQSVVSDPAPLRLESYRLQSPTSNLQSPIAFFFSIAVLSLVLAFGWFTPLYPFLFRVVPGFALFQGPARWLSVFTIALCVLAGIGAQTLLDKPGNLRRSVKWIVIGVALIGAGSVSRAFLSGRAATFPDAVLRLGVLVGAGGLLFGLRPAGRDRRFAYWAIAFVGFVALDLLTAHGALNPTIEPALYRAPAPAAEALRAEGDGRVFMFDADDAAVRERFGIALPFDDFGPATLEHWLSFRASLIANTAMIDGVPAANNFDSLLVGRYVQLREALQRQPFDAALRLLDLMHVRYIASTRALDLPIVQRTPAATIYRNASALPRAWFVPAARVEPDALSAILDPSFDPRAVVILDLSTHPVASAFTHQASRFTLHSLQDTPNTVTIRAAAQGDGYLVLADTWYPGWQATVDDQLVDILRANFAFRAVRFPAGEHVVRFRYESGLARTGMWISLTSAAVTATGLILAARRRR
ncbi:MAG TPA: YfhO family protein [Anaerolineae bacterium]|nr:YfhO family protein [Anaerolineae bacterium]